MSAAASLVLRSLPWWFRVASRALPLRHLPARVGVRGGFRGAAASVASGAAASLAGQRLAMPKRKIPAGVGRPAKRARHTRPAMQARRQRPARRMGPNKIIKKRPGKAGKRGRVNRGAPTGTSGDVQYMTRKLGRRPMKSLTDVYRKINVAVEPCYYRWQNLTDYSDDQGAFLMRRVISGGTIPAAGALESMPLFLFNVSCIANNRSGAGGTDVNVAYQLHKSWVTGAVNPQYKFVVQSGNSAAGGGGANKYTVENANQAFKNLRCDCWDWLDVRMDCIGPTSIPTEWLVQLVQFKDSVFEPEYVVIGGTIPDQDTLSREQERVQLWDSIIQPAIKHPILLSNPKTKSTVGKRMKVLYSMKFVTQPKESIDLYASGQEKMVKIFKWMNRLQSYDWREQGRAPQPATSGIESVGYPTNTGDANFYNDVAPEKRVYLLVRAQNQYVGIDTKDKVASFDIIIRKKHSEDIL